jgi:DNA-binding cell septation regulator SpoVG
MTPNLHISNLRFAEASEADQHRGLLGFVRLVVNDALVLDGITLRRTAGGRMAISFPSRRDARGGQHYFVRPTDDMVRLDLERQVLEALHIKQELPS